MLILDGLDLVLRLRDVNEDRRVELRREGRIAWGETFALSGERIERALPELPAGRYRGRLRGGACLREVAFYGP